MSLFETDLRQLARRLTRRPTFVVLVVCTLGIGVGASTTIFSVLDAVVLQPLPFSEPDRLVALQEVTPQGGDFSASEPNFLDYQRLNESFAHLGAYYDDELSLVAGDGQPLRLRARRATASYFEVLGLRPRAGRTFTAEEDVPGGEQSVAVISDGLWHRVFGREPEVVGRTIDLAGRPHQVVGVLEPGIEAVIAVDVFVPLRPSSEAQRSNHMLEWIGRLATGVTPEAAQRDLSRIAAELGDRYPDSNRDWGVRFDPLREAVVGRDLDRRMAVLLGAVGLLLLIACANVSNLMLAQGLERRNELAVRTAMGASRGRLLRQLTLESTLLSVAGAGCGLLFASWALPLVQRFDPGNVARLDTASLDTRAFAFASLIAVACGLIFGLIPAWRVLSGNLIDATGGSGRRIAAGSRLRDVLVIAELALATTLLLGATLLGRSLVQLLDTDLGIETERVVAVPISLTGARYDGDVRKAFFGQLEEAILALPGVEAVSATNKLPIGRGSTIMGVAVDGRASTPLGEGPSADWRAVRPGIFATLGVPITQGRAFVAADLDPDARVVIISASLAEKLLPGENPIGARLALWEDPERVNTVVGVAANVNDTEIGDALRRTVYFPDQGFWPWMTLLVRTGLPTETIAEPLRRAIWAIDPTLPIPTIETLDERKKAAVTPQRFTATLMGAFSLTAALLAAIGIYGLLSFVVTSRAHEIGIRMALGARQPNVLSLILRRAMHLTSIGIGLGLLAALALTRTVESLLFETAATHPATYLSVTVAIGAVAFLASYLPAWRASRLDPIQVLGRE